MKQKLLSGFKSKFSKKTKINQILVAEEFTSEKVLSHLI